MRPESGSSTVPSSGPRSDPSGSDISEASPKTCSLDLVYNLLDGIRNLLEATLEGLFNAIKNFLTTVFLNLLLLLTNIVPANTKIAVAKLVSSLQAASTSSTALSLITAVLNLLNMSDSLVLKVFPQFVSDSIINPNIIARVLQTVSKGASNVSFVLVLRSFVASLVKTYTPTCPK